MNDFFQQLKTQRWDDHRYYHHSRINQSLHLISAISFVTAYALLFVNPAWAALLAWTVSMSSRQAGHFFFEPRGYDTVNQATDEHKEDIKIGYNIRRKIVLLAIWGLALGVAGLVFRVLQLWIQQDLWTGIVWATKIITDPFHDIMLYYKAPLALLRGEMIDPMEHVNHK